MRAACVRIAWPQVLAGKGHLKLAALQKAQPPAWYDPSCPSSKGSRKCSPHLTAPPPAAPQGSASAPGRQETPISDLEFALCAENGAEGCDIWLRLGGGNCAHAKKVGRPLSSPQALATCFTCVAL
jgi:hypothetical protein